MVPSKRRGLPLHRLPRRRIAGAILLIVAATGPATWASPPPVPRSQLPQIETQIRADDPKIQLQGLVGLIDIERGITQDLAHLLPRVLQLCGSGSDQVAEAALYLTGRFQWLPETRRQHGPAILDTLTAAMASKKPARRKAAIYATYVKLVDEQPERGLPILLAAATDPIEYVRTHAAIAMGKLQKPGPKVMAALRKNLGDSAVQVRRQAAYSLARHPAHSTEAIPQLLKAVRDPSGEVSGGAFHALTKMGEPAVNALMELTDDPRASIRRMALNALATSYATITLSQENGHRISAMVEQKLADPDPAVRLAAAIRISIFGRLEARVAAVPILVKHASGKSSLEGWNAYVGLHRCVRVFASGLTDKTRAQHALGGFRQFDRAYLKQYLRESQEKFKGLERGDLRPLLKTAAKQGAEPEHRAFAALALSWLSAP